METTSRSTRIKGVHVAQTGVSVERECTGPVPTHLPPSPLPLRPGRLDPLRHGPLGCCTPGLPLSLGLWLRAGRGLTSRRGLGGGLATQHTGRTLQGIDVALELLDLGVPGRDGHGDLAHGRKSTGGPGGMSMHWPLRAVPPGRQWGGRASAQRPCPRRIAPPDCSPTGLA